MLTKLATTLFVAAVLFHSAALGQQTATGGRRAAAPVAVGDAAPDFTLEDQNGRKLTLSAERGKKPVVLVFYRGYW